ncbi:hypothetical protein KBD69_04790 [Candidatus Woesebacteria bacterium]|nr:hypothetical protein [Candidatus Woesebacteria bacterium]
MTGPGDRKEKLWKVEVESIEPLQDLTELTRLEMPLELAHQIGECLREFYGTAENNLLALLAPPGQDGATRFVDAAVELDRGEFGGGYEHALHQQRLEHKLEDRELVGFASVFPVESDIATAFGLGHRVWISLGGELIKEPWEILTHNPNEVTVWAKAGKEIKRIQAIGIESSL